MIDYPCPACGYDGPHSVIEDSDPERHIVLVECGNLDCSEEFTADVD